LNSNQGFLLVEPLKSPKGFTIGIKAENENNNLTLYGPHWPQSKKKKNLSSWEANLQPFGVLQLSIVVLMKSTL